MHRSILYLKWFGMAVTAVMLLNFLLFVFHKIQPLVFWGVIIVCALIAYKGIPFIKSRI